MTTPQFAVVPAGYPTTPPASFNVNNGTLAKVIREALQAAVETSTTPRLYGGATMLDLVASSTDAVAKDFALYSAVPTTTQGAGTTGVVSTSAVAITRTIGDFIADGWVIGDVVSIFGAKFVAPVAGCEGLFGAVSAVSSTVLTFTAIGTAWSVVAAISDGSRICRMALKYKFTVPANAGNSVSISNYSVLNNSRDASIIRSELKFGDTELIVIQPIAALSALPASVMSKPQIARY